MTAVLGINALDDSGEIDNETSVLGVQNISESFYDDEDNLTSVLGVSSYTDDAEYDDAVTFVSGNSLGSK